MVPVASTTSLTLPRSTFAVKCCACEFRFRLRATSTPATTTTPTKISHFHFVINVSVYKMNNVVISFVSQRFDRIESRRLARWIISKKYADSDREHRGHDDRSEGHLRSEERR